MKIRNSKSEIRNESRNSAFGSCFEFRASCFVLPAKRGFTLVELIVAVGLFALIMTLSAGAYLLMIAVNRQVQSVATGIDNLSFALEDMTRSIRTGTGYSSAVGSSFSFTNAEGNPVDYRLVGGAIEKTRSGVSSRITEPSVTVGSLTFYPEGTARGDQVQARVVIVVSGTVSSGPGKTEPFTVETSASMRGSDL